MSSTLREAANRAAELHGSALALRQGARSWTHARWRSAVETRAALLERQGLRARQVVLVPDRPVLDLLLMQRALVERGAALLPCRAGADDADWYALARMTGAEWRWSPDGEGGSALLATGAAPSGAPVPDRDADRDAAPSRDANRGVDRDAAPSRDANRGADRDAAPSRDANRGADRDADPSRDAGRDAARDREAEDADPLALLVRTSGSTGTPRVAMLTARTLRAAAAAANERLALGPGDLWLGCLRLSHIGGLSIPWRCALAGAAMLWHEEFDAAAVLSDLHEQPVTHVSLVPPMLARLLDLDPTPPPTLRVALVGGQALSPALTDRALAAGWPLRLTYGMTETASQTATAGPLAGVAPEPGVVGWPLPGLEIDCPDCGAEPARLRLRGDLVMAGYANPERRRGQGLADGWFETADLVCRAADGQLRVLGRADDLRSIGGTKVSLARVELALRDLPGVAELAVVALEDPVWGWRLAAVYRGTRDPASLEAAAAAILAPTERPRAYVRRETLPLLDSGKYDRVAMAALAAARTFGGTPGRTESSVL